jgi:hypothetical protein
MSDTVLIQEGSRGLRFASPARIVTAMWPDEFPEFCRGQRLVDLDNAPDYPQVYPTQGVALTSKIDNKLIFIE